MSFVTLNRNYGVGDEVADYTIVLDAAEGASYSAGKIIQESTTQVNNGFLPSTSLVASRNDLDRIQSDFMARSIKHFGVQYPYQIPDTADGARYKEIIRTMLAWWRQADLSIQKAKQIGGNEWGDIANDVGQIAEAYYDRLRGASNPTPFPRGSGAPELPKLPGLPDFGVTGVLVALGAIFILFGSNK